MVEESSSLVDEIFTQEALMTAFRNANSSSSSKVSLCWKSSSQRRKSLSLAPSASKISAAPPLPDPYLFRH